MYNEDMHRAKFLAGIKYGSAKPNMLQPFRIVNDNDPAVVAALNASVKSSYPVKNISK